LERRNMAKITKRSVGALKPAGDRDVFLWDDELPGFGVRCRRSGARVYFLKYRTAGGRQHWLTLGQHGPPTPDAARAKALREKAAIGDGDDPSGTRQRRRCENTIAAIADRYVREHVRAHNRPSTPVEVSRIVEKRIKPGLRPIKITELTRSDIKAWHQGMSATPYEANRALACCSGMLSLAATDWELRSDNPCIASNGSRSRRESGFSPMMISPRSEPSCRRQKPKARRFAASSCWSACSPPLACDLVKR
jgi:Arm DNA-binding domain/Phage integrase, N-terminal SAM-like domain